MEKVERMNNHRRWILMFFLFIAGYVADLAIGESASMVNNQQSDPLSFYGGAISGSIALIALCNIVGRMPLVSFIGRYSMLVLCTHMYLTNALSRILMKFDFSFWVSSLLALIMVCICYYAVVPVVRKIKILECLL